MPSFGVLFNDGVNGWQFSGHGNDKYRAVESARELRKNKFDAYAVDLRRVTELVPNVVLSEIEQEVDKALTYTAGDLFSAITPGEGDNVSIIAHVCNNKGAFGAGFVVPLAKQFPASRDSYLGLGKYELGTTQLVYVSEGLYVANMIAQDGFPSRDRPIAIDYNALTSAMNAAVDGFLKVGKKVTVFAPLFGAGIAGGDWNTIENMIKSFWLRRGVVTRIFYIPGKTPLGWKIPE